MNSARQYSVPQNFDLSPCACLLQFASKLTIVVHPVEPVQLNGAADVTENRSPQVLGAAPNIHCYSAQLKVSRGPSEHAVCVAHGSTPDVK